MSSSRSSRIGGPRRRATGRARPVRRWRLRKPKATHRGPGRCQRPTPRLSSKAHARRAKPARRPARDGGQDRRAFFGPSFVRPAGPGIVDLAKVDAGEADASRALRQSLEITLEQQTLRPRLQFAHANEREAHGLNFCSFPRADRRSTVFEVIELTDIRAEYVHDGVSRIEEHPVAKRGALDLRRRKAGVATGPYDPVGDRADVHAGPAGGYDHPIGKRRLPASSIETMFSAFASSSPSTMICDKELAVGGLSGTAWLRGSSAAAA